MHPDAKRLEDHMKITVIGIVCLLLAGCGSQQRCDYGLETPSSRICIDQESK
jgi:hypothetical protein